MSSAGDDKPPQPATTPNPTQYKPEPPKLTKTQQRKMENYSAGKPSKFSQEQLMKSQGVVPLQAGTNQFASQSGMKGFGTPRDVKDKNLPTMY